MGITSIVADTRRIEGIRWYDVGAVIELETLGRRGAFARRLGRDA